MLIGSMIAWNNSSYVPDDYLVCDGSSFDISKYPKLYQVLKSNKLPDMNNSLKSNINGYYAVSVWKKGGNNGHQSSPNRWNWGEPIFTNYQFYGMDSTILNFKAFNEGLSFSWNIKWIIKAK